MHMHWMSVLLLSASVTAGASANSLLEQGYRQMYNLQFAEAHHTFAEWKRTNPADPMGPVSDAAAYLFSEFDRLHILQSEFFTHDQHFITDHKLTPDASVKQEFQKALQDARDLAAKTPTDKNAQFAAILASGLESDYLALIEKRYAASFQKMKASRQMAERLLAADPECYDAYIAIGVENYMLSTKAATVRWALRLFGGAQTSREVGLQKLKLTAEKGHYMAPFARLMLAVTALRENDTGRAYELLADLIREYPLNPLYRQELARLDPQASRSYPR